MRIHSRHIYIKFSTTGLLTREDVEATIKKCKIHDYVIVLINDIIECVLYRESKFDLVSFKIFITNGYSPTGESLKKDEMKSLSKHFKQDENRISSGTIFMDFLNSNYPQDDLVAKREEEIVRLKLENQKLRKRIAKRQSHVTFNTIINMPNKGVKINDIGYENLNLLTTDDKREILTQRDDIGIGLKCIEKIHANPRTPENCNLHVTNRLTETVTFMDEGKWINEKDNMRILGKIIKNSMDTLGDFARDNSIPDVPCNKRRTARDMAAEYRAYGNRFTEKVLDLLYSCTKTNFHLESQNINILEIEEDDM